MRYDIYKITTENERFYGSRRTLLEAVKYGRELIRTGGVSILDRQAGERMTIEEAERKL